MTTPMNYFTGGYTSYSPIPPNNNYPQENYVVVPTVPAAIPSNTTIYYPQNPAPDVIVIPQASPTVPAQTIINYPPPEYSFDVQPQPVIIPPVYSNSPSFYNPRNQPQPYYYPISDCAPSPSNVPESSTNERPLEYIRCVQQLQNIQQQLEPIEKPWYLWFIAIIDILSGSLRVAQLVYYLFTRPFLDPTAFIWNYFLGSIGSFLKLLMGFSLLAGLRSKDDSSTLWHCKLWVGCQLVFLGGSLLKGFIRLFTYSSGEENGMTLFVWFFEFIYRIGSFLLVKRFITKLSSSEKILQRIIGMPCGEELRQQGGLYEDQNVTRARGAGESSFCGPTVALIMSMH